ncbi:MAG: HDOD domain-containing protein [Planctomycetota bacterium]|jgi:putative nucleotidyltransferase with HDIG domain
MRRILFVDNDPNTTQKLSKMLKAMCPDWSIETTVSGDEALDLTAKSPFDVIVSDIHIQGMDGIELLGTVSKRHPETVRIIHSEFSDLRSTMIVHQFLMKPCCAETMKNTIVRTCKLRDLLKNETLRKIVTGIRNLPSLPSLYNLIVEEMQSPEGSLKKVGHLISQDVSMSAKILQLVNSAFFSLPQKVTDPQQASVFVGIETLKSLILSIHLFSSLTKDAELCGFSPVKMWRHSLRTGRLAGDIARAENADRKVVEEAMIAGMLHDIGKLILLKIPQKFKEVMDLVEKTGCTDAEAEFSVMEASHAELGAYLLGLWGLPGDIVESVAFHHKPSKLIERMFIMSPEKTKDDLDNVETAKVNLKPQPIEKYSTEFTALTAVHVANALTMQGNCSSDTTSFPYLDMLYLETLELTDKITEWIELYENTAQLTEIKFR